MPSCKSTIMVQSITLTSNGVIPGGSLNDNSSKKNNAIAATLTYPNGNLPGPVTSVVQADVQNNARYAFDTTDFFGPENTGAGAPGLFRSMQIDDDCPLSIQVTDNQDAGKLALVIEKAFGMILSSGSALIPGGQIIGQIAGVAASAIGQKLSGASNGTVQVIGAADYRLKVADLLQRPADYTLTLPLIAPTTISKTWFVMQEPPEGGPLQTIQKSGDLTTKGQPNGSISLFISSVPVP